MNTLQLNYSKTSDTNSDPTRNILKSFEDLSNNQLINENNNDRNDKENNILNIKFPIDNSEFNFMIIDANLGIAENLNNLFFLEFDLSNSSSNKEKIKFLREINNECVEREIFFVLNVIYKNLNFRGIFTEFLFLKTK